MYNRSKSFYQNYRYKAMAYMGGKTNASRANQIAHFGRMRGIAPSTNIAQGNRRFRLRRARNQPSRELEYMQNKNHLCIKAMACGGGGSSEETGAPRGDKYKSQLSKSESPNTQLSDTPQNLLNQCRIKITDIEIRATFQDLLDKAGDGSTDVPYGYGIPFIVHYRVCYNKASCSFEDDTSVFKTQTFVTMLGYKHRPNAATWWSANENEVGSSALPVDLPMAASLCQQIVWRLALQLSITHDPAKKQYTITMGGGDDTARMGTGTYSIGYTARPTPRDPTRSQSVMLPLPNVAYADPLVETPPQPEHNPPKVIGKLKVTSQPPWDKLLKKFPVDNLR